MSQEERARQALRTLLEIIGEDPDREGLKDTPDRVLRSWTEIFAGYHQDPAEILSTTFEEVEGYQEFVLLKDIPFDSTCEHHMLPFDGRAHIAYLPSDRVVGLSKLARLVDCFARRLQIQERMTQHIAQALMTHLGARGVAVLVEGVHGCMTCRGVRKEGSTMVTTAFEGEFARSDRRAEFLMLTTR
ncbi:GTP cyclohydrolase I FolE [bacterium]|nr:GTP cyclohydrolase I FolE [bacterium]